jgi:glycosyltransferase involved in cell wall biosynthesis
VTRPLRVLLFSPIPGRDPASGDTSYTECLLAQPPPGVEYVTYAAALADGTMVELGRRPAIGREFQPLIFIVRALEMILRRLGLMYREPTWWVRIQPGHYDVAHLHLFAVRQTGARTPVVSSAGYPLPELYRRRERWSPARCALATLLERSYARLVDSHVPWLRSQSSSARMTVYSEAFRSVLLASGEDPAKVSVVSTFLEDSSTGGRGGNGRTLAFIGRDFVMKGGKTAVLAFAQLRSDDPSWRMVVVTSHRDAHEVPRVPGLEVRTAQDRHDVQALLSQTDVLLAPTSADCGAPFAVLEALRAGVPVVISDLRWLDERLDGAGIRRVPRDPMMVAAAASDLVRELPLERRGARDLFDRYFKAPGAVAEHLLPLYRTMSAPADQAPGILFVAPARDVRRNEFDGFAVRHRSMLIALASETRVVVAVPDEVPTDLELPETVRVIRMPGVARPRSRRARLGAAVRAAIRPASGSETDWTAWAQSSGCDRAITVGPWQQSEYRPVWGALPSLHLFEEELLNVAELAPQSLQARLLRRLVFVVEGLSRMQPRVVVTISDSERGSARRRFPRVPVVCVPFGLDRDTWPEFATPSEGEDVLLVGNFAEARNAAGLLEVLRVAAEEPDVPRFRVISGPGLHPCLTEFVTSGLLTLGTAPGSMAEAYRGAWSSLVPARIVTGQKTTILQAWSCAVPVITTPQCAATVSAPEALLVGSSARELVDQLLRLQRDPGLQEQLVTAGLRTVSQRHTAEQQNGAITRLCRVLRT